MCSKREAITTDKDRWGQAFDNIFVERLWNSINHEDVHPNDYATLGELLMRWQNTVCSTTANVRTSHWGNRTPDAVHASWTGGGAMVVDKYGAQPGLTIAPPSTVTAFGEVRIENESAIQTAKTGATPISCEKSGST